MSSGRDIQRCDPDIRALERRISVQLGAEVRLEVDLNKNKGAGGWLKIKYFDNEMLSGILDRLGIDD